MDDQITTHTKVIVMQDQINHSPIHSTSPGSGSHCPFPIHMDRLEPLSTCPGAHVNVIFCPSSAGSIRPTAIALVTSIGLIHLPARV